VAGLILGSLIGGLALLLYGLQLANEGIQAVSGARLRTALGTATRNRFVGVGLGALITAALQSSNATTIMLVGLTGAGLLTFPQTLALILGADIGATLTVQLIAFHALDYAPWVVAMGFGLYFFSRLRVLRYTGLTVLGFGLIFLSLTLLSEGLSPLRDNSTLQSLMLGIGETPWVGIVLSAMITALFPSSAVTLGITIALAAQGLLTLQAALPIILGANVGTCATALLSSLTAAPEARRVAMAHATFKVLGVLLIYPFLDPFASWVSATADGTARQIANAHTFFNLSLAAVLLPFLTPLGRMITYLVPEPTRREAPGHPRYLDPLVLDSPALALGQAAREALRMADITRDMYRDTIRVFTENNAELLEEIERQDDWVDSLNREIKLYITKLSHRALTEEQSQREVALLAFIGDLENIGDIIDRNLMELAKKKVYKGLRFSDRGLKEIVELHGMIGKNLEQVVAAFIGHDAALAQKVLEEQAAISHKERELRAAHIARLHAGLTESIETSAIHLDVLTNLVRINHHITSIAYPIVETKSSLE
jgi:phosphate:Na+ symporter